MIERHCEQEISQRLSTNPQIKTPKESHESHETHASPDRRFLARCAALRRVCGTARGSAAGRRISSTQPSLPTPMPTISNLRVVSKVNFTYESKNSTRSKNRTTFYPHPNRSNRSVASESTRHAHERINSGWSPRRHGAQHQRDLAACDFPDRLTHPAACPATGSSSTLGPR